MAKSKFVFVNKTAKSSSLSRSDGYEKSRIFSHAQTRPVRKAGTFVITTIGSHDPRAGNQETRKRKSLGEVHDLAQSDFDPFQSFCVVLDKGMQNMLAYFLNSIVPSNFPVAYVATEAKRHVNMHAIEDAAFLYGLLGVAHATVAPTGGQDRHAHEATLFKHKTLVQIQQDLRKAGEVKATTAYAVALLVRMECGQGNMEAVRAHYNGLIGMMQVVEAPSNVAFPLLVAVQASLNLCAATLSSGPHAVTAEYDEKSHVSGISDDGSPTVIQIMLTNTKILVDTKFVLPVYRDFVGEGLFDIIMRSCKLNLLRQRIAKERVQLSFAEVEALCAEPLILEHRLLSMRIEPSTSKLCNPARDAIRLAFYVLCGPKIPISRPENPFRKSLGQQLRQCLKQSAIRGLWQPCPDLLLWALFITAHVCYQQDDWPWVISQIDFVCHELEVDSLIALAGVLSGFGLDFKRFDDLPQVIWSSIQDLRTSHSGGGQGSACESESSRTDGL